MKTDKHLKILYFSDSNSYHLVRRLKYLTDNNLKIYLISQYENTISGITQLAVDSPIAIPKIKALIYLYKIKKHIRAVKPDIIHISYCSTFNLYGSLCNFHPLILTCWGGDVLKDQGARNSLKSKLLFTSAIKKADLITAVSNQIKNEIDEIKTAKTESILLRFGIDTKIFYNHNRKKELKRKYNYSENDSIIFSPRLPHPLYNIDTIVFAFQAVLKKYPKIKLILNSNTFDNPISIEYYNKIMAFCNDNNIRTNIIEKQHVSDQEMAEIYNISDIVISIPSSDGSPLSVFEAMACEIPVICSDLPSIREFISPMVNGFLINPKSSEQLSAAIVILLEDNALYYKFTKSNLEFIKREVDFEKEMQNLMAIYNRIVPS